MHNTYADTSIYLHEQPVTKVKFHICEEGCVTNENQIKISITCKNQPPNPFCLKRDTFLRNTR